MPYLDYYAGKLIFTEFSEVCKISKDFPEKLFIFVAQDGDFPLDELVKTCRFLISGGLGYFVTDTTPANKKCWIFKDGVECEVINRAFAKQLLTKANSKKKTVLKPAYHYKAFEATPERPNSE
jgi:hypothetical protein